jgi:hypothetical protein
MAPLLLLEGERQPIVNRPGATWPLGFPRSSKRSAASELDDLQERRELRGRRPNAREDAEAAPGRIYVVPPGCWGYGDTRSRGAASSATPVSGDDVEVRNTWGHGLWSIFAGVRPCRRASPGGGDGPPLPRGGGTVERPDCDRLGRSPATIKAYFYDPTGDKAKAVKARYVGVCRGCGAYTQPRNGKGDAYAYCKACHPGAIQGRWTRERVLEAMGEWLDRYGRLPSSYDWSRTHARRRGQAALRRLEAGEWPPASVVTSVIGSWAAARATAEVVVIEHVGERTWRTPGRDQRG